MSQSAAASWRPDRSFVKPAPWLRLLSPQTWPPPPLQSSSGSSPRPARSAPHPEQGSLVRASAKAHAPGSRTRPDARLLSQRASQERPARLALCRAPASTLRHQERPFPAASIGELPAPGAAAAAARRRFSAPLARPSAPAVPESSRARGPTDSSCAGNWD